MNSSAVKLSKYEGKNMKKKMRESIEKTATTIWFSMTSGFLVLSTTKYLFLGSDYIFTGSTIVIETMMILWLICGYILVITKILR